MPNNKLDVSQYELFNTLNNIVLFKLERLAPWEKNFISDLHDKAITGQPISNKQKQLIFKISKKTYKLKKKNGSEKT